MLKLTTLLLASAAATIAPPTMAQTAENGADIIITATGTLQSRDETGQAITVIDADTIRRRQDINVADLLATTPGIRFSRSGTTGSVTGISVRGAETTQTLVLIDGVKVNDTSGIGDAFDFGNLLVGNIRRIEVLRGSNSVAYGSQAIGGVVNIATADPIQGIAADASAEYGYSDTINAKASVSGGSGIVSGSAGVSYFNTDGISSAARSFGATERDGYRNITGNAKLNIAFTRNLSLDLRGYYIDADLDNDLFFNAPADTTDITKSKQYIGYAGVNAALFDGAFRNRFAVTYFRNDRDTYSVRGDAKPAYGYTGDNKRFEYQGIVQPVEQAKLIVGYEHEKPKYDYADLYSTTHVSANLDSVYGLAVVQPLTGLSVTGGLRYSNHSQFGGATTLGANASYTPNDGATVIRVSYGEGFKAPSLYQLYDGWAGNPTLQAERSKSYDAGIEQAFLDRRVIFSLTAFQRDVRNQIDYSYSTYKYYNTARTRSKGVEATAALHPVDALTLTAAYSYIDARDRAPGATFGQRLLRRAANQVSVSADYDWAFGLSTGATLTMVGDSIDLYQGARVRLDGYAIAGLRASFPVGGGFELYGRVDNLFDQGYATIYGYGTYGRSAYGGVRLSF